jgi:hypothetical protein
MDDLRQYFILDDIAHGIGHHGKSEVQIKKDMARTARYIKAEKKRRALEQRKEQKKASR